MTVWEKLEILGAAASYDHSCTGTGFKREAPASFEGRRRIPGIYLAQTADGRCLPLLKVLFTNRCRYDCVYCVNRASKDVPRASFEPRELAELAMELYRKGVIRGIFLSSAVARSADYTMERMLEVARLLRQVYSFRGYLHLKLLPGSDPELVRQAVRLANRVSANLEFVRRKSLALLAPGKEKRILVGALAQARRFKLEEELPTSLTTQVIVGATQETDYDILRAAQNLYRQGLLKRMYFSAYLPVNDDHRLPPKETPPPLLRERRLYEADFLMRLYGFSYEELLGPGKNLDLAKDPKLSWAERHPEFFPVELKKASYEELIRVPGIGPRSAKKLLSLRKDCVLTTKGLARLGIRVERALPFITIGGKRPARNLSLFSL
ncbi:putative DNA modification/repair radical SAM protein [Thermosulfurimonas dismutans]|uniref:Biotin synthase related domain containing protein n=1 Tax=Thermosulfurimonas dismutans TaxID=999894 RepID=A0A179D420_9BACT|nr:putative DNA modification/repair radical SAM protein [Thermosulfurimonas dismutans]OAQ20222.1 Biotin synthase related domain containing protein [Thermosulfurimonas dismutans]